MGPDQNSEVDRFIEEQIDTVPHLEALLLAWRGRSKTWSPAEMAAALYVPADVAQKILSDLSNKDLLIATEGAEARYAYRSGLPEHDELMARVNAAYQRELIRISRMIHSKAPTGVREFARSFRFTKEEK